MNPLFEFFGGFTNKKTEYNEELDNQYSQFMLNRFVSMVNGWEEKANIINKYSNIPNKNHYEYYKVVLPQRFQKINYLKEEKVTKDTKEILEILSNHYEISLKDAKIYYSLLKKMNKKELDKIINSYRCGVTKGKKK